MKLDQRGEVPVFVWGWLVAIAVVLLVGGGIDYVAHAIPSYNRSQRLANENNQTKVNDIQIAQTAQLVKVHQQQAQIRIVDAQGLAQSQKIINNTLTPAYLQYEAIQAQEHEVNSNNHTVIYIPTGQNGIPLVSTVPQQ